MPQPRLPCGQVFALSPRTGRKSSVHGRDMSSFSSIFLRHHPGSFVKVNQEEQNGGCGRERELGHGTHGKEDVAGAGLCGRGTEETQ